MKWLCSVAVLGALALPATSFADPVIASGHLQLDWNVTNSVGPASMFMEFPWRPVFSGPELFTLPLAPELVGLTFRETPADPPFAEAAAVLTNGTDDYIGVAIQDLTGTLLTEVFNESNILGRPFGSSMPDLRGAALTAITLTFTSFDIQQMQQDRYASVDAMLGFEGTPAPTPEPAPLLLLLSAGTMWLIVRRRAFRKGEAL
ncbi:MAG TPA: PEP-CTERM sorting domain-containing protein [Vicinamibacterales bacterium]|nr:PEP-CTERM sorting domain-containing protein [Vicinamibacterales bacterium]